MLYQYQKLVAIDPSLVGTGICIMQNETIISTRFLSSKRKGDERMQDLVLQFIDVIQTYKPKYCAIESAYLGFNANTTIKLSELKGAFMGIFWNYIPDGQVFGIKPLEAKSAVGVSTNLKRAESKLAVRKMVGIMYPEMKEMKQDLVDSVSIALAGYNKLKALDLQKLCKDKMEQQKV